MSKEKLKRSKEKTSRKGNRCQYTFYRDRALINALHNFVIVISENKPKGLFAVNRGEEGKERKTWGGGS